MVRGSRSDVGTCRQSLELRSRSPIPALAISDQPFHRDLRHIPDSGRRYSRDARFGSRSPRGRRRRRRVPCARRAASRDGVSAGLPVCRQPPRRRGHRAGRVHQGLPLARPVPLRRAADLVALPDRDERVHRPQAAAVARRLGAVYGRGGIADGEHARQTSRDPRIRPTADSSARCSNREIARLPPGQRLVFTMRHHEGLKLSEIAGALGLAEGTVKRQLHAAVHRLRAALTSARVTTGGRA